jgi:hypothetical protein
MKKDIFTAVVGSNKTESLLPDDFFYCSRHILVSPFSSFAPLSGHA